jgi:hypothetical protein
MTKTCPSFIHSLQIWRDKQQQNNRQLTTNRPSNTQIKQLKPTYTRTPYSQQINNTNNYTNNHQSYAQIVAHNTPSPNPSHYKLKQHIKNTLNEVQELYPYDHIIRQIRTTVHWVGQDTNINKEIITNILNQIIQHE